MNRQQTTEIQGEELAELDFVAFLSALGFGILSRERIRRYDLVRGREDKVLGVWRVTQSSADGKYTLRDLRRKWGHGVPSGYLHGMELDAVAMSRLALHNFRALTQLGKFARNGCELYEIPLGPVSRLNNEHSFEHVKKIDMLPAGDHALSSTCLPTLLTAVAVAFGCRLLGYTPATSEKGTPYLRWHLGRGTSPLADPRQMSAWWSDEKWLLDPTNDTPLAVAMMTLKNRKALLADANAPRELTLLSRLERHISGADGAVALIDRNDNRQVDRACQSLGL